ncbi:MAG: hypothetical protein ACK5VI_07405 [Opitutia bacterium]
MKLKTRTPKPLCMASPARIAAAKKRAFARARRRWGDIPLVDMADVSREMFRKCGPISPNFRRPRQPR